MAPRRPITSEDSAKNNNSIISSVDQVIVVGLSSVTRNDKARVYECIICRRGFSSAQALGGHMNIHRKDKVKIKHRYCGTSSIDQTARFLEMIIPRVIQHSLLQNTDVSWRNDNDNPSGETRQLPLFANLLSNKRTSRGEGKSIGERQDVDVHCWTSPSEGHGFSTVDLELRLGPEPRDYSSRTRKFF